MSEPLIKNHEKNKIDWTVTLFLILNPLIAFMLLPIYLWLHSVPMSLLVFTFIFAAATNLSITAGYHRLFAHKSYEANGLLKILYLFVGASAFQGSALKWASDHRRHHGHVDTDNDPYSIKKGFWYAHMGWMFFKKSVDLEIKAPDLEKDPWIAHQNKYYIYWAIIAGFIFPAVVGYFLGSALGGLIIAGAIRIFVTQQSTFFVNSLCHTFGRQTYSKEITAKDSFFVALLTHGEGYHNFHHKFQIDYRNGIKWYHWDPTKWTIKVLAWFGFAKKLKTISAQEILKARLQVEALLIEKKGFSAESIELLRVRVLEAQNKWKSLKEDYEKKRLQLSASSSLKIAELQLQMKKAKSEFQFAMREWQMYLALPG